jgi:hypothetical protein
MTPTTQSHAAAPTGWRKSSHSTAGNDCVEVAQTAATCAVRDSKDPDGGHIAVTAEAWRTFTDHIKGGGYDL